MAQDGSGDDKYSSFKKWDWKPTSTLQVIYQKNCGHTVKKRKKTSVYALIYKWPGGWNRQLTNISLVKGGRGQVFQTVIKWKTCFYTVMYRKLARVNKINGLKIASDGSGDDKYPF